MRTSFIAKDIIKSSFRTVIDDVRGKEQKPNVSTTKKVNQEYTKDCQLTIKICEGKIRNKTVIYNKILARNLQDKKAREKIKKKNSSLMKNATGFLTGISSPNLMYVEKVAVDAYVKIQVEESKFRTRTIYRKLNPFWVEETTFDIKDPVHSNVRIYLVDENKFEEHEVISPLLFISLLQIKYLKIIYRQLAS